MAPPIISQSRFEDLVNDVFTLPTARNIRDMIDHRAGETLARALMPSIDGVYDFDEPVETYEALDRMMARDRQEQKREWARWLQHQTSLLGVQGGIQGQSAEALERSGEGVLGSLPNRDTRDEG